MFGLQIINKSDTCATSKLVQCYGMGVYECDISHKFEQSPEQVLDLTRDDFLARKKVVDAVARWCSQHKGTNTIVLRGEWTPILYDWEVRDITTDVSQSLSWPNDVDNPTDCENLCEENGARIYAEHKCAEHTSLMVTTLYSEIADTSSSQT